MNPTSPPEITNLVELEKQRDQLRHKLRIWHLFVPASGDDVRAYKALLRFVRPYRGKLAMSVFLAMVSALFLGIELAMLQGGLSQVLGAPTAADLINGGAATVDNNATTTTPEPPPVVTQPSSYERAKDWLDEKRAAFTMWFYEKVGIDPPPRPAKLPKALRPLQNLKPEVRVFRTKLLWLLSIALVIAVICAGAAKYGQEVMVSNVSRRVVRDIRSSLFKHLLSLSVRFHQRNHSAELVARITNDLEVFGRFLTEALVRFIQDGLDFLAMIAFVAANQGSFIFIIAGVIAVAVAPVNAISRKLRRRDKESQQGTANIATVISEALVGQRVVKAFAAEEREFRRFREVTRLLMRSQIDVRRLRSLTEPIVLFVGALGIAAVVIVGGQRVLSGHLDATGLVVNVLGLARAMAGLRGMSKQMNDFQLGLAAADRVGTVLQAKSEIHEKPDAVALPPFTHEIRFDDVHFRHEEHKPTLRGINLVIKKGEKIALVGPSGAGKTTFIDLLPRFYDIDEGSISVDGHDLRDLTLKSLREQISIVSQETILFRDSIRDNIAYGRPDASDDDVIAAAKAANAHDFIVKTKHGYATRVGERGLILSGGERQRISIARALLRDPPILILDEATSALDSESEAVVQAALQRLMSGRTVIVIAHRLSTIRDAHRIVVIEKGRIVEIGNHAELMSRPDSLYRRHYEIQTRHQHDVHA